MCSENLNDGENCFSCHCNLGFQKIGISACRLPIIAWPVSYRFRHVIGEKVQKWGCIYFVSGASVLILSLLCPVVPKMLISTSPSIWFCFWLPKYSTCCTTFNFSFPSNRKIVEKFLMFLNKKLMLFIDKLRKHVHSFFRLSLVL